MTPADPILRRSLAASLLVLLAMPACSDRSGPDGHPPAAPEITAPVANAEVSSPVTVTGTGLPGAAVTATLYHEADALATAEGFVATDGTFSVDLDFPKQTVGTAFELQVTQATGLGESAPAVVSVTQGSAGNRYVDPEDAPRYQGTEYSDMQIYDVAHDEFLDDMALMEEVDDADVVFFGEQHETAPIHELQLWMLTLMTDRHEDVALAMEHFQSDAQSVMDDYLAGNIEDADLIRDGDAWDNFGLYWLPLVDHMKALDRPVIATNIPDEALDAIYANGLSSPLAFVNTWDESSAWDAYLPPRPLSDWNETYQAWFETGYDYASHGQSWGLTYDQALDYFTDLAAIRDHTMGYFIADHVESTGDRVFFVGGDWHVQTGLATPDYAQAYTVDIARYALVTTTPRTTFESMRDEVFEGRHLADFILIYE